MNKEQQIKNSFIYLLPVIVINALPFLTLPIFTRILTPDDYGVIALAQVYGTFAAGLSNFGLIIGFERNFFQYEDNEKRSQLLYSVLAFVCIASIVFGFLTFFLKQYLAKWVIGSPEFGNILFIAFCASSITILKPYFLTYYKNLENAKANVKYTIIDSVLCTAISLFLIVYLRTGIIGIFLGQIISGLFVLTILTIKFMSVQPLLVSWPMLKDCLLISLPLTPRIFLKIVSTNFDKYMLGLLSSIGGVGVYDIGQKISTLVFTYMTALQSVFSPQVYKRMFEMKQGGGKSIGLYLTPFVYFSIAFGIAVSLFSEEIIILLIPSNYYEAKDIVIILSMYYGILFFGKQPQLIYAKKTHIATILFLLSMFLNIGLNIPFIIKWGIYGAAWATFIAGLLSVTISFIIAQHYYRIEWEYNKLALIYIVFFVGAISMICLHQIAADYIIRFIFKLLKQDLNLRQFG